MKIIITVLFVLTSFFSFGQVQKGDYMTSGSFRVRSFNDGHPENKLEIGITNKTGYFLTNSIVVGLQMDYTFTRQKTNSFSSIQQEESQWYEKGLFKSHEYALGLFADKYFMLGEKLYATAGLYGQYYDLKDMEKGQIYTREGEEVGILYETYSYPNLYGRIGLTGSLVYFLNDRFGINCKISAIEIKLNRYRSAEFDFQLPIMNFGLQYHFNN